MNNKLYSYRYNGVFTFNDRTFISTALYYCKDAVYLAGLYNHYINSSFIQLNYLSDISFY